MLVMAPEVEHHLDEEQIESYSMGIMPAEELARSEEHLLICEPCQRRVAESDRYVGAMERAAAELRTPVSVVRRRAFARWLPIAASLVVLVFAAAIGLRLAGLRTAGPAFAVRLEAMRGAGLEARVPAGRALAIQFDLPDLPAADRPYGLEIVDSGGGLVWHGTAAAPGKNTTQVPPMQAGGYFVRLRAPTGKLLREYAMAVEKP
jgi:hypothetical protein